MNTDLIITTYNRPDALEAVLVSVMNQTVLPCQVIVADDGSGSETRTLITRYQMIFPIPLVHSWRPDDGFRAAEARNRALSKVISKYVILIDGDMVLHRSFISDHLRHAEKGRFLQGGRVMMTEEMTKLVLAEPSQEFSPKLISSGLESRLEKRLTAFRSRVLAYFFSKELKNKDKVRSCNMSFFFDDARKVNGFNNDFVGWGREDSEFVERLSNSGVRGKLLRFVAIAYHLYHFEATRDALPINDAILNKTKANKLIYCKNGLSEFLCLLSMCLVNFVLNIAV
ncbi:MAG: glycosyltransferase family 2 protein [Sphingobacterium sp.]|jgi:glycosyltransferase involved in cell wall biosynthesis|nr:glycosyltransferase family 2 protein [Sphingobacterium sp.]